MNPDKKWPRTFQRGVNVNPEPTYAKPPLSRPAPIDMVLHCPKCHMQHIDQPSTNWNNEPHRTHLCARCGCYWRPADVPTNGVAAVKTRGVQDTWPT